MNKAQENIWLIAIATAVVAAILAFGLAMLTFEPEPGDCIGIFRVAEPACQVEMVNINMPEAQGAPTVGTVASYGAALFSFWVILVAALALREEFSSARAQTPAEIALAAQDSWSDLVRWGILVLLTPFIVFGGSVLLFAAVALASENVQDFTVEVASVLVAAHMGAIVYLVTIWIGAFRATHLNAMAGAVFIIGVVGSAVSTTKTDPQRRSMRA